MTRTLGIIGGGNMGAAIVRGAIAAGVIDPKNILVAGDHIFIIDFEISHYGDPSFDPAFLICHLVLKAFHRFHDRDLFFALAREFSIVRTASSPYGTRRTARRRIGFGILEDYDRVCGPTDGRRVAC